MFLINSSLFLLGFVLSSFHCSLKNAINFKLSHFSTSNHSWHERGERSSANFSVRAECDRVQRKSQHNTIFSLQLNSIHPFWNSKPRTGWRKRENRVSWQQGETHRRAREQEQRAKGKRGKGYQLPKLLSTTSFFHVNDTHRPRVTLQFRCVAAASADDKCWGFRRFDGHSLN